MMSYLINLYIKKKSTPDYLSAKFEELAIESSADERPNATTVIDYLTGSGQERPEIGDKPLETVKGSCMIIQPHKLIHVAAY